MQTMIKQAITKINKIQNDSINFGRTIIVEGK